MKPKYSPMMMQYLSIKEENQDSIVMFRLGDFYEMFFEDALTASRELEIDRKSTRLNSSHSGESRMPSSA